VLSDRVEVRLRGGRAFRAAVYRDGEGVPLRLLLWAGLRSDSTAWPVGARRLTVPIDALPRLRAALERLEEALKPHAPEPAAGTGAVAATPHPTS
jgi:hypothetical protein